MSKRQLVLDYAKPSSAEMFLAAQDTRKINNALLYSLSLKAQLISSQHDSTDHEPLMGTKTQVTAVLGQ